MRLLPHLAVTFLVALLNAGAGVTAALSMSGGLEQAEPDGQTRRTFLVVAGSVAIYVLLMAVLYSRVHKHVPASVAATAGSIAALRAPTS